MWLEHRQTGYVGWLSMNKCAGGGRFIQIHSNQVRRWAIKWKMLVAQLKFWSCSSYFRCNQIYTIYSPFQNKLCMPWIVITCSIDFGCGRSSPWYILIYDWKKKKQKKTQQLRHENVTMLIPALNTLNTRCMTAELTLKYSNRPLHVTLLPLISFTAKLSGSNSMGMRLHSTVLNSGATSKDWRGKHQFAQAVNTKQKHYQPLALKAVWTLELCVYAFLQSSQEEYIIKLQNPLSS